MLIAVSGEGDPVLDFCDQLKLLLIDKLLIGALVGAAVLGGSHVLERYKAKQGIWAEAAKRRVDAFEHAYGQFNEAKSQNN